MTSELTGDAARFNVKDHDCPVELRGDISVGYVSSLV